MTREEAIKILRYNSNVIHKTINGETDSNEVEALDMAISALEHPERNVVAIVPCGDAISRQEAIDTIRQLYLDLASQKAVIDILKVLPSVTPYPRKGHWIPTYGNVKCSVCGSVKDSREVGKATHYCDFCGAKMESER